MSLPTLPRPAAWFLATAIAGFISVPLAGFTIAQPWRVEGRSMEPAIEDGSMLLVDTVSPHVTGYGRGDVVVLPTPTTKSYVYPILVKRIVGVAGDHIEIGNGRIRVNGSLAVEPYLGVDEVAAIPDARIDVVVPPGCVFVMGDRRENSYDSKAFGPVPVATLMGRAWVAVAPGGELELPGSEAGPADLADPGDAPGRPRAP